MTYSSNDSKEKFPDGFFIKERTEKTPDYVLASFSIHVDRFSTWLKDNESKGVKGWLNIDIKKAKESGNKYAELNVYQPKEQASAQPSGQSEPLPIVDNNTPANSFGEQFNSMSHQDVDVEDIPF